MVLLTKNRSRFSCVPGFIPFRRSTVSVTVRKPQWIQDYIILKLRISTIQHQPVLLEAKFGVIWIQLNQLIRVLTLLGFLCYQTYYLLPDGL